MKGDLTMRNYYFNNSAWVFCKKLIVISEPTFRKIKQNFICNDITDAWNAHWLCTEARNITEARELFEKDFCK